MSAAHPTTPDVPAATRVVDLVVEHVWHVVHGRAFAFCAATAAAFVVFFARAPGAWVTPMFFAEDRKWTSLLLTHGFWHTVFDARPDYAVFGNVAVLWTGVRLCDLFGGGDPLDIPRWQALASYALFAMVVSLPVLLLPGRLPRGTLPAVWALGVLMPLGIHDASWSGFEILGRATNVGFAALPVAFLLLWVRLTPVAPRPPWRTALLDAGLLACVATNPMCIVLVPVAAVPIVRSLAAARSRAALGAVGRRLARDPDAWSLGMLVVGALACSGGASAARGDGGLTLPPFDRAVELGLARSMLYALTWPIYRWLNTDRTLLLAGIALWLSWRFGRSRHRLLHAGGLALLAVASAVLVACRRELSEILVGYRTTFPDRYFYAQYLVGLPLVATFAADVAARLAPRGAVARLPLAGLYALVVIAAIREPPWRVPDSQFIVDDDGCFARSAARAVAARAWRDPAGAPAADGRFVGIPSHPRFPDEILLPRDEVVRAVARRRAAPRVAAASPAVR